MSHPVASEDERIIRVVVADDHPIVRSGVINELERDGSFSILGEAENGDQALEMSLALSPDVLILDINMPGTKAVQVVRELISRKESIRILVLSAYGDAEYVFAMLRAGANGFMLKDEAPHVILEGLRAVYNGETWLSSTAAENLVRISSATENGDGEQDLSSREVEVLVLLARGYSNERIAGELSITEGTVKNHVSQIYMKLGLHSRAEAVAWAWEHGVVSK
jgi:DNA-binding NarL/FixJ family response regulator